MEAWFDVESCPNGVELVVECGLIDNNRSRWFVWVYDGKICVRFELLLKLNRILRIFFHFLYHFQLFSTAKDCQRWLKTKDARHWHFSGPDQNKSYIFVIHIHYSWDFDSKSWETFLFAHAFVHCFAIFQRYFFIVYKMLMLLICFA